ncbi:MAG: Hsp20/alpha crystallin family protein [Bacteriovoracaceae bacterium]
MSGINNNLTENKNVLKRMNQSLKNQIDAKADETRLNEQFHNEKIKKIKKQQQTERHELNKQHTRDLVQSIELKNQKLLNVKKSLDHSKSLLDKEKKQFVDSHNENIQEINNRLNEQIGAKLDIAKSQNRDLAEKTQRQITKINNESKEQIADAEIDSFELLKSIDQQHSDRVQKTTKSHEQNLYNKNREFEDQVIRQEKDHKDSMTRLLVDQKNEQDSRQDIHQAKMNDLQQLQLQTLKEKDEHFKIKVKNMIEAHGENLKILEEKFKNQIEDLKIGQSKIKEDYQSKSHDKFYQISKIEPKIRQDKSFYYFDIEVPVYEKEKVHVTANDREVKISLSRDYKDNIEFNDQNYTSSRTEVLSKEFEVPEILNGKDIKKSYEDGILSYRIAKK